LADAVVVYQDQGITPGMQAAIDQANEQGLPIEYRELGQKAENA
jgi:pheromone shutdown protein TraB